MEPEEGPKEDQTAGAGNVDEINKESTVENTESEVNKGAAKLFPVSAEELERQDQEILRDFTELNQGEVDMLGGETALGKDVKSAEAMAELELKNNAEKEESEELGGADQRETGLFVSSAAGEAEEKTGEGIDQWEIKEHEEEGIVGESRIFLEMGEKKVVLPSQDQREKDVHADTEEKNDYPHNLDEKIKETTDRKGLALEKAEVLALDQKDSEGGTREDVAETAENQIEDNELSRLGQGGSLEMTEEGKDVAAVVGQKNAEEILSTGDSENMTLEGGATSVVFLRETEESIGLSMEQNKVLIAAGDSALDEAESPVLIVPKEEESEKIIEGEKLTFGEYQDKEIAEVDQRETDSLTAGRAETSVESQGKPEEEFMNLREAGGITAQRDSTMVEEEARLLEANQIQVEETGKEEVPSALGQGEVGKAEAEVGQVEAEMGSEEKDTTTVHQMEAEELAEGRQGESVEPVGEQKVTAEDAVTLTVVESMAQGLQEKSEMIMEGEDIKLVETELERVGKVTAEEDVTIPVEDKTRDLVETSEVITGKEDEAEEDVEAEREIVGRVAAEDDVSLAVVEVKAENLVDSNTALNVETKGETVEGLIAEKDVELSYGGEVAEAPESVSTIQKEMPPIVIVEIPVQSQEKKSKEKMESGMVEERESEQLTSADMVDKVETEELEVAVAINQNEGMETLRPFEEKAAESAITDNEILTLHQQDAVGEKLPSREKILVWSPELEGPTQEKLGLDSGERISRSGKEDKPETNIRITEELGKLGFSVAPSRLSQRTAMRSEEQSCKGKGKIIVGLSGLRQGPIQLKRRGPTRSAGAYNGVLAHIAPGFIVTGLTKAEQKRLTKEDHKQLGKRTEQRETRSAEQGRFGVTVKTSDAVVLMGYRIGREGMSCSSEAEKRMVKIQQVPELEEMGKKPVVEQAEVPRQEQEGRKEETQESNANEVARHHLEELQAAWLGRQLTQDYTAAQKSSRWTAGTGPGRGHTSRSLQAEIKERINMMVIGEGTTKSSGQNLESLHFGLRKRVFGLTSKVADVHWLNEVLRSGPTCSRLGATSSKSHDKEESPGLMSERQSPGLFTRKKELKDWRDGVMGIAIKRYNAVRLAMWGEGPFDLHVKGMKLKEDPCAPSSRASNISSILGHVERRMLKLAQHVANETVAGMEVDGQRLNEVLKQDMKLGRSKKGERFSRSSLPLEIETLDVQSEKQVEFSAQTANSESGSPERRLGCQGTQELDGSSQWLADQNEAGSQHALEQDASTTTTIEAIGTRGKEQERIKMQNSPPRQHHTLHTQTTSDKMTGSNPVSPASSGSPVSSGSISPSHLTHDSSLDSHLSFDGPKSQNRALVSSGMYMSPDPASMWDKTHAEIAEQAKHEAEIENRIAEMKKEGFWSMKRLSKVPEPIRPKVHWDYLCEEMQWLSADFAQERRWKRGVARKVVRMVIRHHEEQKQKEERAKREEQAKLRRIASSIAKEVKQFWSNVEKVVQFKQQSRLEEKRKKALDLQLDFIVGQTEKYSDLLTQSLNETLPVPSKSSSSHAGSTASSPPPPAQLIEDEDGDFQPHEESDDEETIEVEEQQEGNDSETQLREIELLKQESELPLEELLQTLPPQILENSFSVTPCASSSDNDEEEGDSEEEVEQEENQTSGSLKEKPKPVTQRNKKPWKPDEEDEEFTANEEEAEDEEETIDAEEKLEGNVDHSKELDDLAKEGELPMEELLQKYAGAYSSDFEVEASDTSSEALELTTSEYEEESEEEDSTSHSDSTEEIEESEQEESEEQDALEEERREASVIQEEDFGVEYLLKQDENGGEGENDSAPAPGPKKEITDIAAAAESLQPKGYTLATTQVKTPIPYLLRGTLREYQHIGLDWLVTMYEKKLNGILADEMGLGKTIQTISLLAHLACEKGSWGPHLIIVPTSVMLNWEMEIKRWCPSFKILTYYGAQKERKLKRQGWTKPNAFHICITSYKLVLQDHQAFRRKNWKYLILDEAQNIKNFKSQRWQSLLNFNSQRRLLLTGTPLQNSLMELWSLMHFLMPHVFQSHREFKEWFSNPLTGMIEGSQEYNENLVKRLHKVLRPFLLRRVKVDVEKQMPKKYEHVIKCRLSKRQRYLYDDFMAQATTKETLATGHFMSVINILMQLRKVCNHPNLFDPRPIHSPFITEGICFNTASLVLHALDNDPFKHVDLGIFDLINLEGYVSRYETDTFLPKWKVTRKMIEEIAESPDPPPRPKPVKMKVNRMLQPVPKPENRTVVLVNSPRPTTPLQRPMTPVLPEPLTPALAPVPHVGPVLPGPLQPPTLPVSVSLPVPVPMPPSPVTMSVPVPPSARPQTPTLVPTLSQNSTAAALLQSQASVPQVLPMAMTAAQLVPNTPRPLLPPPISPTTTTTSSLKAAAVPVPMGQQPPVSTLSATPVRQQPPINTLGIASVGGQQQQPPISTLGISPMAQQQPINTQSINTLSISPINTLGVTPVGGQQPPPPNTLGPGPAAQQSASSVGGMVKPMNIHSAVPTLPGYNFATAGGVQQRLLLSPDMQARLPSGEVVSIGQLASLANRPLQGAPGSKPLTFQIQGNKLTLTGTQVRQVTMPQPARQLPRNVVHLVSAGGQHHIISQPAQVALIQAMAQQAGQNPVGVQTVPGHQPPTILPVPATSTTAPPVASTATISVPIAVTQVPSSAVNSSGVVKIVVRQAPRDGLVSPSPGPQHPPLRPVTPTTASALPGLPTALLAQRAPLPVNPVSSVRLSNQPLVPARAPAPAPLHTIVRPMLRMIQASNPNLEQQLVPPSPPPTVAPFAITPAATVTVPANTSPTMVSQITSSPMLKEEPEMLTLRSTTPTPPPPLSILAPRPRRQPPPPPRSPFYLESLEEKRKKQKEERLDRLFRLNEQHCNLVPMYGTEVLRFCTLFPPAPPPPREEEEEEEVEESEEQAITTQNVEPEGSRGARYTHCYAAQVQRGAQHLEAYWQRSETLAQAILTPQQRIEELTDIIERFIFVMPPVEAPAITMHTSHPPPTLLLQQSVFKETLRQELSPHASCLHRIVCNMRTQFPDLRLIQYDCGKLQTLDVLLRQLKAGAHRVLIFTQMTRMLDVLEQFLNYHGHIYLRLDGSTRVEQRQALMERFNADKRIFCFILSTRSGGVGVNLTGADTVVFYDSDWNPTMDAQAQDRCHRIGQTRDVHIYRLISERTVEENILKKANQKRMLGDMAIEGGNFTTAYFKQQTIRELFDMPLDEPTKKEGEASILVQEEEEDPMATKQTQILEQALCKAEDPEDIRAATQAKAEQVAELAEFNENIPLDAEDRPSKEEEEEISKAEQEIASLVEQLTPIERYAMNFLEASLEDISREELKQAEEQVEAARKDIDQAKDEVVFKLPEDEDESYLPEEGSSKKSKKAKMTSRLASERTGTRMSERLRGARLPPRDGDSGEAESPQIRLPNLRHPRIVTDEEDDNLPQVAQHTRSAAVRRELVREEKRAQIVLNTRRTLARREEPWNKGSAGGERMQKMPPHRSEASGDRVLRTNLHRTDTPSAGDKLLQATPQKSDPGAAGDRILRGTTSKTETLFVDERLPGSTPQSSDPSLDKVLRPGLQKPEKPAGLDQVKCSSPKSEVSGTVVKVPGFHVQGLGGELFKLKADVGEQNREDVSQPRPPTPEFQAAERAACMEVPAFQEQDAVVAGKLLTTQTLPDVGKAVLNIPAIKMKAANPVPLVTVELTYESKSEAAGEINLPLTEQKKSVLKPAKGADGSTSYCAAKQESVDSMDEATRQVSVQATAAPPDDTCKSEPLSSKSSKDTLWETTGSASSFMLDSEVPKVDTPVFPSLDHSPATSSLLQLETLACVKEQNGLKESLRSGDFPSPVSGLLVEPQLEMLPLASTLPVSETADNKINSLGESTTRNQGVVGEKNNGEGHQEARLTTVCPGSAFSPESTSLPGNLSSDESLSPNKPLRRRTSADVQIQQSCQTPDGPAAKVLRKLPGRLVTVVEEKMLIRRRRNRMCKLDSAPGTAMSPGSSSAQSLSEPETLPSTKALPLLRDLPARRRIELESRAAAKERDSGSKGELLGSTSSEPVKRKRGRPPKNKSPDQQSPGLPQPCPESALEVGPHRKALVKKMPETKSRSLETKSLEQKMPDSSSPKSESPKSKTDSSENGDSPVEKRRRGRPPKVRQLPILPPKSPASDVLLAPSTKPQTVKLPPKVQKKLQKSPTPVSATEAISTIHESLELHPKMVVSKTSPKARNRASLHSKLVSVSKSTLNAQELLTTSPRALSKLSTEGCELLPSSSRGVSATETSVEMQEPPCPPPGSCSLPKSAPCSPAANSPPKRKRGRPPKNPSSPRMEVARPPASVSDQETSLEKHTPVPPGRKRRRRRKKDDLGPSLPGTNQSSSEGEDTRPLTRLALLKREERPEPCSGVLVQPSPKHTVIERASSAESNAWEQPSSDTPARSTRLRPGCLVPPLERETQRRKRRCSLEGNQVSNSSKSPASQGISEQEGGESESSLKSSSESNSYQCIQQPKRQCYDSARGHSRKRGQRHRSGMADRILRSAVKPADNTRSASSPIPPRKSGPACVSSSAGGVTGALSPSTVPSSAAPVTSLQSNRGRKPKT